MTFREKYLSETGYDIMRVFENLPCPSAFMYEDEKTSEHCIQMGNCEVCWERQIPTEREDKMKAKTPCTIEKTTDTNDNVNHPIHYTKGGIECIDCIESIISSVSNPVQAFLVGQVVKYLYRYTMKNGLEDLRKSQWYLNRLIAKVNKDGKVENN